MAFKKALIERALGAELGQHLGYSNGAVKPEGEQPAQRHKRQDRVDPRRPAAHRRLFVDTYFKKGG
jgi:transposase-like protein